MTVANPKRPLQDKAFVALLIAVSLAFAWMVSPFYEAVLWATVLAILFASVYRRLTALLHGRRNTAAVATVVIILLLVILPAMFVAGVLLQQALGVVQRIQSGEIDFAAHARSVLEVLPAFAVDLLDRYGLTSLATIQQRASAALVRVLQYVAAHAVNVGQGTADFVVTFFLTLYLIFFLLRDGPALRSRIRDAIPLDDAVKRELSEKFVAVVRAIVKGTLVVAIVQGTLGGIIFAILGIHAAVLWGVLMALLSLLPLVGAALIWLPAALYLLATGALWQGIVLIAYGVLVIGLVDNVLRPLLVGKDTQMPDYVVLLVTLGGIAVLGFNGFVIGPVVAALFIAAWQVVARSRT